MIINMNFNNPHEERTIDIRAIQASSRRLRTGIIAPAEEYTQREEVEDYTSEPIKSMDDIIRVSKFLIMKKRYRDNMIFIVGINFGLRVSDLVTLRFADLINAEYAFKDTFTIWEQKTKNTKKKKRNRYITINKAVMEAVTLYLENTPDIKLSDYMFKGEGNRSKNSGEPLSKKQINRILQGIAADLGLGNKMSTHSMRKTFAYHQMVMSGNDPRKLLLLQKMLGHANTSDTLSYIGITGEEIEEAYQNLNLGSETCNYLVDGAIIESDEFTA